MKRSRWEAWMILNSKFLFSMRIKLTRPRLSPIISWLNANWMWISQSKVKISSNWYLTRTTQTKGKDKMLSQMTSSKSWSLKTMRSVVWPCVRRLNSLTSSVIMPMMVLARLLMFKKDGSRRNQHIVWSLWTYTCQRWMESVLLRLSEIISKIR